MPDTVIQCEALGKSYLIGHEGPRERYTALRDVLANQARNLWSATRRAWRGNTSVAGDLIEEFWALKDISFEVKRGEVIGIIGRNGAGKSTLLKILSRITEPSEGRVTLRGRVASLLEVGTGFHPELTGRENIFLNGAILGMSRAEIKRKFDEIVAFAEVEKFLDTPVKRYSSGMYVRLAFAVAAHLEPEILIVDEVLAVGDAEFQKKCLGKMQDVAKGGRTVLFVSHNMSAINSLTKTTIVLSGGQMAYMGPTSDAVSHYIQLTEKVDYSESANWGRGTNTRINRANIVSSTGKRLNSYEVSTPLRFEVEYETNGAPGMSLDLFLMDQAKTKIAMASLYQFEGKSLPTTEGKYICHFHFQPLTLATGRYFVDVTTAQVNVCWDHYVHSAIVFDVNYSNPGSNSWDFKQSYGFGALALTINKVVTTSSSDKQRVPEPGVTESIPA